MIENKLWPALRADLCDNENALLFNVSTLLHVTKSDRTNKTLQYDDGMLRFSSKDKFGKKVSINLSTGPDMLY